MARRSSSHFNLKIIITLGILILIAATGGIFLLNKSDALHHKYERLDANAYLANSNSLRGNKYQIDAEVMADLALLPSNGRLFSFSVDKNQYVLPVLIPTSLNAVNIQKGQHFIIVIEVMENGILCVQEITKA